MNHKLSYEDLSAGKEMLLFAKELYPMNRSLMGPDIRNSYSRFREKHKEFKQIEFNTGDKVFDWTVPKEWIINDAFIEHESGKRFALFSENNLHLMGYSAPVDKILTKEQLLEKIHTHPTDNSAIPYVTSYYKEDWAFCMSSNQVQELPSGNFRVFIDSKFLKGKLCLQEALIKGESDKEIFFSSYLCHPSMANNELSGPVLLNKIIDYIKSIKNKYYSYRFVLLPETIGSIAYLSLRKDILKKNVFCGFNLTCVGDDRAFSHVESRLGNNLSDNALCSALIDLENVVNYSYLERGSDERQYCAPGIELPLCTFCRTKFGEYDEYHSSKDDFDLVTEKGLAGSFSVMKSIIRSLEFGIYPQVKVFCEPQLGKRGLYPNTSKLYKGKHPSSLRMDIIAYCDGKMSIFDIAKKLKTNLSFILDELILLQRENLIHVSR